MDDLPAGGLRLADDFRDLGIAEIEYIVEQEHRSFVGAQIVEDRQKSDRYVFNEFVLRFG